MASPRVENAQQVQIAIIKIHGHLQEQMLKGVFTDVCFHASEAMTMDAGAEKRKWTGSCALPRQHLLLLPTEMA